MYLYTYTFVCICRFKYIYKNTYICINIYIYVYIHLHLYIYNSHIPPFWNMYQTLFSLYTKPISRVQINTLQHTATLCNALPGKWNVCQLLVDSSVCTWVEILQGSFVGYISAKKPQKCAKETYMSVKEQCRSECLQLLFGYVQLVCGAKKSAKETCMSAKKNSLSLFLSRNAQIRPTYPQKNRVYPDLYFVHVRSFAEHTTRSAAHTNEHTACLAACCRVCR